MENKEKKIKGGRKPTPYPEGWEHIYTEWQSGEFSSVEACRILNLPKGTFYNMAKRYETQNGIIGKRHKSFRKEMYKGQDRVEMINGYYGPLSQKYNDFIEKNILPRIDYKELYESCQTEKMEYAKGVFNYLHKGLIKIYGSDTLAYPNNQISEGSELVLIPGIIYGNKELSLALLILDLYGRLIKINFLTETGVCKAPYNGMSYEEKKQFETIEKRYSPYIYGYAAYLPGKRLCVDKLPYKAKEFLSDFKNYEIRLLCGTNTSSFLFSSTFV